MLSNTNEIHISSLPDELEKQGGLRNINDLFEKVYLSYEVGCRKPDQEIFELVLKDAELKPSETLFIDDSIQHVEGAKKVGIRAHWLNIPKGEDVHSLFS